MTKGQSTQSCESSITRVGRADRDSWTPAEDAILDFLWLKHQSFNDVLDIIVEIFPHRCGPGGSPLQAITTHLRKHKSRYEAMDMSLKGEAIVERLKELGLLDDLEQADLDKIGGPSRRSIGESFIMDLMSATDEQRKISEILCKSEQSQPCIRSSNV